VVFPVLEVGFEVHAPGVLGGEQQLFAKGKIGGVAKREAPVGQPVAAQAREFAVGGDFPRIGADTVNPGVADFGFDDGQLGAAFPVGVGEHVHAAGHEAGARMGGAQAFVNGVDLGGVLRAEVVAGEVDRERAAAGQGGDAAVVGFVNDDDLAA